MKLNDWQKEVLSQLSGSTKIVLLNSKFVIFVFRIANKIRPSNFPHPKTIFYFLDKYKQKEIDFLEAKFQVMVADMILSSFLSTSNFIGNPSIIKDNDAELIRDFKKKVRQKLKSL